MSTDDVILIGIVDRLRKYEIITGLTHQPSCVLQHVGLTSIPHLHFKINGKQSRISVNGHVLVLIVGFDPQNGVWDGNRWEFDLNEPNSLPTLFNRIESLCPKTCTLY